MVTEDSSADIVLRGGLLHVLDVEDTRAEAIAIRDGRIVAIGDDSAVAAHIGPRTAIVELDGRAVLPGINDAHLHASWLGALWPRTIFSPDGPPPEGPLVTTDAERRDALLRALELLASLGITSFTEPGIGPGEDDGPTGSFGSPVLRIYRELAAEGLLTSRVTLLLLFGLIDGPSTVQDIVTGIREADTASPAPDRLRIAGVKVFADGIPPMRNAYIHGDYPDGTHGALMIGADAGPGVADGDAEREAALRTVVSAAQTAGLQVAVHATGDRAIDVFVDAVLRAQAEHPADLRHYVVHADLLPEVTIPAVLAAGMGTTIQPGIADLTGAWLSGTLDEERSASAWPVQQLIEAGVPVTLSSDAPVITPDWRQGIAAADRLLGPAADPRARMHELLRRYTAVPAWQDAAEREKGTLEVGKLADLVVLAADPDAVGAQGLPDVAIVQTYLGGELVFDAARTSALRDAAV